jgi:peptidoglycan/LPS O-acetylase OafA/YrhL
LAIVDAECILENQCHCVAETPAVNFLSIYQFLSPTRKPALAGLLAQAHESYRPDIDGLRAVAVLSVILFHIKKSLLPGGFVGVDIFFVISGFLITRNILDDLERRSFSILDFYRRRVKRIAPAMFVVILATLLVAQFILLPVDAEKAAQSALWSSLSLANAYFWLYQDTGYFANASEELPLLHLWSLGVEEQFYLLWPLVLLLAYPLVRGRYMLVSGLVIAALSFAGGQLLFERAPAFTYYMLPTRAGELMLGALVAIAVFKKVERVLPARAAAPMAWLGAALVAGSLFLLSKDKVFPGLLAVPPTLGAALLILAGHCRSTGPSRFLTLKPLVWVGVISYSAYLWHWPLLAFYRYGYGRVDLQAGAAIFVLTLALAWLTYLYVEQPVRRSRAPASRVIAKWYAVPAAAMSVVALGAQYLDGYGFHFFSQDYRSQVVAASRNSQHYGPSVCLEWHLSPEDATSERCVLGDSAAGEPKVLLWGDSNAGHYVGMLDVFAKAAGFSFRNLGHKACPPLLGDPSPFLTAAAAEHWAACIDSLRLVKEVVSHYPIVVLSGSWTTYQSRSEDFLPAVFQTVQTLTQQGTKVILMGKAPIFENYNERCRARALRYPFLDCTVASEPLDARVAGVNGRLREFAAATANVGYFEPTPYLCPGGTEHCSPLGPGGVTLYLDKSHLSAAGSVHLGDMALRAGGIPALFSQIPGWLGRASPLAAGR